MKIIVSALNLVFVFLAGSLYAQNLVGQWSGIARAGSEQTKIALTIRPVEDGLSASMTLMDIGVSGWPAQAIVKIGNTLKVTFPSDSGPQHMDLSVDGPLMTGTWREGRFETAAIVELARVEVESPVSEQQLLIEGPAGKLGASLIMPTCTDGCPGVVFLHGSGPQPRDSNRFAAQALARHGIASIIFDKRGVGKSEGDFAGITFDDLAADAVAVADKLRHLSGISYVGFFGHSQGGWIAPLAGSSWQHTAFIVTSAGPAVSPSHEAEWNVVRRLRATDLYNNYEEEARQLVQLWHRGIRSGDWSSFDRTLRAAKAKPWFDAAGFDTFMSRPSEAFMNSYRLFMDYDPIPALSSLASPMLAILTPDDESIDAVETESILREMGSDGRDIKLKIYPGYDHSMRRLGSEQKPVRWPEHPEDFFSFQARFIMGIVR